MKRYGIRGFSILCILAATVLCSDFAMGGSTVIRDNRVRDLGVTPALGRGYTLSTNTFQSTCLVNVKKTKPSYDYTYTFHELKSLETGKLIDPNTLSKLTSGAPEAIKDLVDEKIKNIQKTQSVTVYEKKGEETVPVEKKVQTHDIVVIIDVYTYYSSVDEANTRMSETASGLLKKKDIPGFFHSCGSYYVRSICRKSTFFTVYSMVYTDAKDAKRLSDELEKELKNFSVGGSNELRDDADWFASTDSKFEALDSLAKRMNLTISSMAWGLGKDQQATLIAYDLESFRNAVKSAFISMMDDDVGKVDSIEVVPWVENTEFQSVIGLEEETVPADAAKTTPGTTAPVQKQMLYEKKQILNLNAEFLAEIDNNMRNLRNLYFKARICRQHIDQNWKETKQNRLVFKANFAGRYVRNNSGGDPVLLSFLDGQLTTTYIDDLLKSQKQFIEGGGVWGKGANECIRKIITGGIFSRRYYSYPECEALAKQMGVLSNDFLDNYCMPELYPTWYKGPGK